MDGSDRLIDPDRTVRSPEELMMSAAEGHLPKDVLRASVEYHKACAAEWIKIFRNPSARVDIWKN